MARPRPPGALAEEKVPCPRCGAEAGQRCVQANGSQSPYSHAARGYAAMRAGYLPRSGYLPPGGRRA